MSDIDPGELTPGQTGWLPLDEAGNPAGPCTVLPPYGPDARAASVSVNEAGEVVSLSGAPLVPPINSNVDRRVGSEPPKLPPVLNSLSPASALLTDPDFTLSCLGSGFTTATIINFNGGDEPTVFVSPTEVTTGVKPSLVGVPISVPVLVKDAYGESAALTFEFTAPVRRR